MLAKSRKERRLPQARKALW